MQPKTHFLLSLIFLIPLFYYMNYYFIFSLLASVLIDLDNYSFFIYSFKQIVEKKKVYIKDYYKLNKIHIRIFHTPYFVFLLILLSIVFKNKFLIYILIGISYHLFFDLLNSIYNLVIIKKPNYSEKFFMKYFGIKV